MTRIKKKCFFRLNDQGGFTLIEALIALLVFTIGILATVSMQVSALKGNSIARNSTDAAAIAANVIEELRELPFDHANLGQGEHERGYVGYHSVSYTVQEADILGNTKTVQVTVGWADGNTQRSLRLDYVLVDVI